MRRTNLSQIIVSLQTMVDSCRPVLGTAKCLKCLQFSVASMRRVSAAATGARVASPGSVTISDKDIVMDDRKVIGERASI